MQKQHFLSISYDELTDFLKTKSVKSFVATQIWEWVYKRFVFSFDDMSNLSKDVRAMLDDNFELGLSVKAVHKKVQNDYHFSYKTQQGDVIDSVCLEIEEKGRLYIFCSLNEDVSTGIKGCSVKGGNRRLKFEDIISQVLYAVSNKCLFTDIVFVDLMLSSIAYKDLKWLMEVLMSKKGLAMRQDAIFLRTSGDMSLLEHVNDDSFLINVELVVGHPDPLKRGKYVGQASNFDFMTYIRQLKMYKKKMGGRVVLDVGDVAQDSDALVQRELSNLSSYLGAKVL